MENVASLVIWKRVVKIVRQGYVPFVWLLGEIWRVFHAACCVVSETDALRVTEIGITAQIPLAQPRKARLYNLLVALSFIPQ